MVFKNLHTPQEIVNNHIRRYKVCMVDYMILGRSRQRCHAHLSACLDDLIHDFIIFMRSVSHTYFTLPIRRIIVYIIRFRLKSIWKVKALF